MAVEMDGSGAPRSVPGDRGKSETATANATPGVNWRAFAPRSGLLRLVLSSTLGALALLGIPVIVVALLLLTNATDQDYREFGSNNLNTRLTAAGERFESRLESAEGDVLFLSKLWVIDGLVAARANGGIDPATQTSEAEWKERSARILSNFIEHRPEYLRLRYIGVTNLGREVVRVDRIGDAIVVTPEDGLRPRADQDFFQSGLSAEKGTVYISEFEATPVQIGDMEEIEVTLRLATPVFDSNGVVRGLIVANIDADDLFSIAEGALDTAALFYVSDQSGALLHVPNSSRDDVTLETGTALHVDIPAAAPLVTGGAQHLETSVDIDGEEHLLVGRRFAFDPSRPERYLVNVALFPIDRAIAEGGQNLYPAITIIGFLLVAGALIQLGVVARLIVGPLGRVVTAANNIAHGKRSNLKTMVKRRDEVGELARAFQHMDKMVSDREADLRAQSAELERSNTDLSQFAYVASHDLQEPLRMVTSYLGLIESRYADKLDNDANEFIAFAVDGARRMKTLINDLLAYSRVSNREIAFKPLDVGNAIARAVANRQETIASAEIDVEIGSLPTISADEGLFGILVSNLVDNAIKYRSEESPWIGISARRTNGEWEFSFADNGIGIDPKFADQVFVIFARLHARQKYAGTGIGLASCKRIVERHGGKIWVGHRSEGGSVFKFTIPVARERAGHVGGTEQAS